MDTMAPIRQTLHRTRSISLAAAPTAAAAVRREVAEAIDSWDVAVDHSVAALLASELVTNAIKHAAGQAVGVLISRGRDELRVEVHDTSRCVPVLMDAGADMEAGRGLVLVASLASDWGYYRTPAGKAVYFTLAFQADADCGDNRDRGR
jgi:anti-sigma regulatory factor (Ser/Thr protein kinase)